MVKRLCLVLLFFFVLPGALAVGVDLDDDGSFAEVSISSASNLYAYEVNLDYSGSYSGLTFAGFLGSGTTSGSSARNGILSIYESKLDSTQTGVSGSGSLFNLTHSGNLELRYALFIYANGSEQYVYYNNTSSSSGSTSSGTGASGSGTTVSNPEVSVAASPRDINVVALPKELSFTSIVGQPSFRSFNISNLGNNSFTLNLDSDGLEGYISLPEQLSFEPGQSRLVVLEVNPIDKGLITGSVNFTYLGVQVLEVPVVLNAKSEDFLFDALLTVSDSDRRILPGQSLFSQIDLKEVASAGIVDVRVTYFVKDYSGEIYLQETETFAVDGQKTYTKTFDTSRLLPGKYVLGIEIVYPGAFATSSVQFQVAEPGEILKSPGFIIAVSGLLAAVAVIVVFIVMVRRPRIPIRRKKV